MASSREEDMAEEEVASQATVTASNKEVAMAAATRTEAVGRREEDIAKAVTLTGSSKAEVTAKVETPTAEADASKSRSLKSLQSLLSVDS